MRTFSPLGVFSLCEDVSVRLWSVALLYTCMEGVISFLNLQARKEGGMEGIGGGLRSVVPNKNDDSRQETNADPHPPP